MAMLLKVLLIVMALTVSVGAYVVNDEEQYLSRDQVKELIKKELTNLKDLEKDNKDDDKPTKDLYSEFVEHTDMIKKSIDEEHHDGASSIGVEEDDLSIQEGTAMVKEHIFLDKLNGIQIYHTGEHNGLIAVTKLVDSNYGYVVTKHHKKDVEYCIIRKYDPTKDSNPNEVSRSLKQVHNKMPKTIVEREENIMLDTAFETAPKHIKKFCGDRKIVTEKVVDDLEEAAKLAIKANRKGSNDKRVIIKEFLACDGSSTSIIEQCPRTVRARCRFRRPWCAYTVRCSNDLAQGGFNCQGVHDRNTFICCNFFCPS